MRQLYPESRAVDAAGAYGSLDLASRAPAGRPYVVANMVMSADGRAALGGRTAVLSSPADRELFHVLRCQVDAVMVGPATIGLERYGPLVRDEELRRERVERGLEPHPLAVTVTRSMELPVSAPLFQDPDSRIVVLTNSEREAPEVKAQLIVERLPGDDLDMAAAMTVLDERHGVRALLLEGGPTVLAATIASRAVDELFLALSPLVSGGEGEPALLEGTALEQPVPLDLVSVLCADAHLFLRYALRYER